MDSCGEIEVRIWEEELRWDKSREVGIRFGLWFYTQNLGELNFTLVLTEEIFISKTQNFH